MSIFVRIFKTYLTMSRRRVELTLENITLEAVAAEGKALAHIDGQVVFVEFGVPGDVVDIQVLKKKKSYMEGRIIRLVKASEHRLEPFCEHFGVCGGCRWQPLPYPMQLEAKTRQVYDQLVRIGHLEVPSISPIIGSDKTSEYRNKLEFSACNKRWFPSIADKPDENQPALGFHVGRFFDKVLDINHCHLQPEPSNEIRLFIKEYAVKNGISFYDVRENNGILRNIFIRNNDAGDVSLTICFGGDFNGRKQMLDAVAERFPQIKSLHYIINSKVNDSISDQTPVLFKGEDAIWERMGELKFKIGPKSFYQTNNGQAIKLYTVAKEFAGLSGNETVYDLYTGTGTIAQFVASGAAKVIGIEYVEEAIADARINARANGIDNCEFFAGDMKDVLTDEFISAHGTPDVMIVDPPRAGMHPDVIKTILNASPKRIVYVSCNPASQARDISLMKDKYKITAVQPVDMFPHTIHVENVCKLELI